MRLANTRKGSIKFYVRQVITSISFEWSGKVLKRLGIEGLISGFRHGYQRWEMGPRPIAWRRFASLQL